MGLKINKRHLFANIIADGTIRVQSEENNPDAVRRDYELKDGTKGTKFELVYNSLSGIITDIQIFNTNYGENLQITIDGVILSMNITSNFADDVMKKLPNINLNKEVIFAPYSFTDDKGKLRKGVTVTQESVKLTNFFYNPETKENCNGFPVLSEDCKKYSSDDWKVYFINIRKFLRNYFEENILPNVINTANEQTDGTIRDTEGQTVAEMADTGEIKVEDIPFDDPATTPAPSTPASSITPAPTEAVQPTTATAIAATTPAAVAADVEGVEIAIANFAKTKLGVEKDEDVQRVVMEQLGLAYIASNFQSILEKLKAM